MDWVICTPSHVLSFIDVVEEIPGQSPLDRRLFRSARLRAEADRYSCVSGIQIAAKKGYKVIAIDT